MTRSLLTLAAILILSITSFAATETVIYNFAGGTDGSYPSSGLLAASTGVFYGLTGDGGTHGFGTVYRLTRRGTTWTKTVLYNFTGGADGAYPSGDLVRDSAGNLYGTTHSGGDLNSDDFGVGSGVVFKLTRSSSGWIHSVLYAFKNKKDGAGPVGGVTRDRAGNLYGTTSSSNNGATGATVFQLVPGATGRYLEHTLHTFPDDFVNGNLAVDNAGHVYGTTTYGGPIHFGSVFQLTFNGSTWTETDIYTSKGRVAGDGVYPYAGLTRAPNGHLFGTTLSCGGDHCGTVFELVPSAGTWTENILYQFSGSDGANPEAIVTLDAGGNIYGTTTKGGMGGVNNNLRHGTVFQLTLNPTGGYTHTTLHSFTLADGQFPTTKVVRDSSGNLYGTAPGGPNNLGVIYQVTP